MRRHLRNDLVVSSNCDSDPATGVSHWLVHVNTGNGFADVARRFSLPAYENVVSHGKVFDRLTNTVECSAGGTLHFTVVPLAPPAGPDLVVTDSCLSNAGVGDGHWRVHPMMCD
jgi:hypothetical protein